MKKKLVTLTLVLSLILSSSTLACATTKDITNNGEESVTVTANVPSTFMVTIPKQITIGSKEDSTTYEIVVDGDIAGDKTLYVEPSTSCTMSSVGKEDIDIIVSQDKIKWTHTEFDTPSNGSLDASDISAGHWEGFFEFDISLKDISNSNENSGPGAYSLDGERIISWNELESWGFDVTADYNEYDDYDVKTFKMLAEEYPVLQNTTKIVIPEGVECIGDYMFSDCKDLTEVILPDSLTAIGGWAFENCLGLVEIDLPNTLVDISDGAFSGCENLKYMDVPTTIKYLGSEAFAFCSSMESPIYINENVSLGESVFIGTGMPIIVDSDIEGISYYESVSPYWGRAYLIMTTNVTSIGTYFLRCVYSYPSEFTIYYTGTQEQWDAVTKEYGWDGGTLDYNMEMTVICNYKIPTN